MITKIKPITNCANRLHCKVLFSRLHLKHCKKIQFKFSKSDTYSILASLYEDDLHLFKILTYQALRNSPIEAEVLRLARAYDKRNLLSEMLTFNEILKDFSKTC